MKGATKTGARAGRSRMRAGLGLLLAVLATGCIVPRLAPVDLAAPGWRVQETQAVWCPRAGAPELLGELLVATHPDGRRLVQFSKQNLPLVTAQANSGGWALSSSLRKGRFGGKGRPTTRVPWYQLTELPPAAPEEKSGWRLTESAIGWRLAHSGTGEYLEGARP